jgi:hypothetical protein
MRITYSRYIMLQILLMGGTRSLLESRLLLVWVCEMLNNPMCHSITTPIQEVSYFCGSRGMVGRVFGGLLCIGFAISCLYCATTLFAFANRG